VGRELKALAAVARNRFQRDFQSWLELDRIKLNRLDA